MAVSNAPMKTFGELETDDCRWPLAGEGGEFVFCGEPAVRAGCPYCSEHMALAYRKPRAGGRAPMVAQSDRQKLIELAAVV
jgi:hypothetical protein